MSKSPMLSLSLIIVALFALMAGVAFAQDDERPQERIDALGIYPLESIADPAQFTVGDFQADGSGAIFLVTEVPVACNVVYGTTEAFGNLVFDPAMSDFAITEHNPILTGLESNTTYYYRLQGSDRAGNFYLSEVMRFTTPDFAAMASQSENLAAPANGAEVLNYSSAFGNAGLDERWGAGNAFDDNPNTEWSSAGDGDGAWIEVGLAQPARIDGVEFWSRQMNDGSSITREFTITTEDGRVYGPFVVESPDESLRFDVEIVGQNLRFDLIDTTGGNTGVVDIALYGTFIAEE